MLNIEKYLERTWYNAKIPYHFHEDCSQTVLLNLLLELNKDRFNTFLQKSCMKDNPDIKIFLRIINRVKKRFQRIKSFCSIDDVDELAFSELDNSIPCFELHETIIFGLNIHEINLIEGILVGKTLSEIAMQLKVSSKTVSNRKSLIFNKLRTKNVFT